MSDLLEELNDQQMRTLIEPFSVYDVEQLHNVYCQCWECKLFDLSEFIIGTCSVCACLIYQGEGTQEYHLTCLGV